MTKQQAEKLAKQIFDRFGDQIRQAVKGTRIPPQFIAGLVANEAGKDRSGNIRREATRFEPHIYKRLARVARTPGTSYNSIKHAQLKDATDASLRALAHSYEATQMMGYWCIVLGCTLADLKNPDKHFFYCVKLLQLNDDGNDFKRGTEEAYDDEMRQWNTGREKGKTYHANYVPNARLIRAAYAELEKNRSARSVNEHITDSAAVSTSTVASSKTQNSAAVSSMPDPLILDAPVASNASFEAQPGNSQADGPAPPIIKQEADQIINTGDSSNVPPPEDKTMTAPSKDGATSTSTKMTILGLTVPPFVIAVVESIKGMVRDGYVDAREIASTIIQLIVQNQKYVFMLIGLLIVLLIVKKVVKQITFWIQMVTTAIPGWNSIHVTADKTTPSPSPWWRPW